MKEKSDKKILKKYTKFNLNLLDKKKIKIEKIKKKKHLKPQLCKTYFKNPLSKTSPSAQTLTPLNHIQDPNLLSLTAIYHMLSSGVWTPMVPMFSKRFRESTLSW